DIDQTLIRRDLHLDLGILTAEGCNQRVQQDRRHCRRHGKAQQSGRPLSEVARSRACGDKLLEGRLGPRQEALAGLRQADAARRADEQRRAEPCLKGADRLADRGRRYTEFGGGAAKAAMLRDAEERLDAVERALSDCEVLLHSPSILSPIVRRWKRPYVSGRDPERSFPDERSIAR